MAAQLNLAQLFYGATGYPVARNEITPLPEAFDFDHPEACARLIFAIMSNAGGGHRLHNCKVQILGNQSANMTADGVHVYYKDPEMPKFTSVEAAIEAIKATNVIHLGSVITDQYGEGYKRAVWS